MIKKDKRDIKEMVNKIMCYFMPLTLFVLIISFVISLPEKSRLKTIDDYSRVISQIATIIGVFGVFYALKSFKKSEEDSKQNEYSELMKNSIKVLDIFSSKLIPMMASFDSEVDDKYEKLKKIYLEQAKNNNPDIKKLPEKLEQKLMEVAKTGSNIYSLFNSLEQVCAYIAYDLIIEDVVYPTTHKVFLEFLDLNEYLLNDATSVDAPYKNLHEVRWRWKKISQIENIDREQKKLDEKKKQLV